MVFIVYALNVGRREFADNDRYYMIGITIFTTNLQIVFGIFDKIMNNTYTIREYLNEITIMSFMIFIFGVIVGVVRIKIIKK